MKTDREFKQHIESMTLELCQVLRDHGYEQANLGAILLLLGFDLEDVEEALEEYIDLVNEGGDTITVSTHLH